MNTYNHGLDVLGATDAQAQQMAAITEGLKAEQARREYNAAHSMPGWQLALLLVLGVGVTVGSVMFWRRVWRPVLGGKK